MMDDLQQAYNAYQTALVHLPNPKVGSYDCPLLCMVTVLMQAMAGTPTLVWHWHPLRSIWLSGPRRRGLRPCHGNAA